MLEAALLEPVRPRAASQACASGTSISCAAGSALTPSLLGGARLAVDAFAAAAAAATVAAAACASVPPLLTRQPPAFRIRRAVLVFTLASASSSNFGRYSWYSSFPPSSLMKLAGTSRSSDQCSLVSSAKMPSIALLYSSESGSMLPAASAQVHVALGTTSSRREMRTEQPRSVVRNFLGAHFETGRSCMTCTTAAARQGQFFMAAACRQYNLRLSKVNQHGSPRMVLPFSSSSVSPSSSRNFGHHRMISIGGNGALSRTSYLCCSDPSGQDTAEISSMDASTSLPS
mmetsp:Transcript_48027/g.112224  ORF Transcript_48027/g.112224 Transcript_48027/m.112224 type:complete len:287 (-) Transcript_48027:143-1003(-)